MISFPLQNNTNFGIGPFERDQDVLNIQPVIPLHLTKKWNLITRTILPIIWQPDASQNTQGWYGLGDLNPSLFFSPAKPGKVIWGFGPALVFPTATAPQLGQGKISAGPGVVALSTPGHWVIGALANNVWSFAGTGSRPPVNEFLLQYFINYNMKKGWYVTTAPIITANWRASSGNALTLPFGGGVGRIMKLGFQPVNIQCQFFGNAKYPTGTSPWGMRLEMAFLFPHFTKAQEKEMMEQKLKQMDQEQQTPPKKWRRISFVEDKEKALMKLIYALIGTLALLAGFALAQQTTPFTSAELNRRTVERRAVDAVIWGLPLVGEDSVKQAAFRDGKANYNDIVWWPRGGGWKNQSPTPNVNARYMYFFINTKVDGPVVVELPPAVPGASFYGTIEDARYIALVDIGFEVGDAELFWCGFASYRSLTVFLPHGKAGHRQFLLRNISRPERQPAARGGVPTASTSQQMCPCVSSGL